MIATLTIGYRDRNRVLATNGTLCALRCVECGWLTFPRDHLAALVDIARHGHPPRPVIQVTIHGVGPVWEGTEPFGVCGFAFARRCNPGARHRSWRDRHGGRAAADAASGLVVIPFA